MPPTNQLTLNFFSPEISSKKTSDTDTLENKDEVQKQNLSVLIVDDLAGNRITAEHMLNKLNSNILVAKAESGEEAIKLIKKNPESFAAIFLDYNLGSDKLNGAETAKEIKALLNQVAIKSKPIIITWSTDKTKLEDKYEHADTLLQKPLQKIELRDFMLKKFPFLNKREEDETPESKLTKKQKR